jgi:nitrate/nitrite-specific signal transduction histidine kinase
LERKFLGFTWLYALALAWVALLAIAGQVLVQVSLARHDSDAHLVNIAGRQRMLSQKLTKSVLAILLDRDSPDLDTRITELKNTLELWEHSHQGLQTGNRDLQLPGQNSPAVTKLFTEIEAPHRKMVAAVQASLSDSSSPQLLASARVLLENEPAFLKGMDAIAFQYDAESSARVAELKRVELLLTAMTLLILMLEGLFIFRPAVQILRKLIAEPVPG